jgi:hypothetical protein
MTKTYGGTQNMSVNYDIHKGMREDDLIRKYGRYGDDGAGNEKTRLCDGCFSKIYAGDTVYLIDRFCYCSECVEETEYTDENC